MSRRGVPIALASGWARMNRPSYSHPVRRREPVREVQDHRRKKARLGAPNRKRTMWKLDSPATAAIRVAKIPHVTRMRAIHFRAPNRCIPALLGTSKIA
jgi:hypothetical protein